MKPYHKKEGKTKRKKKSNVRKLQEANYSLWKEIALKRDGEFCQVKKHRPDLKVIHSPVIQVDHFITRRNKHLFLDVHNSTVVCSACNMLKNNHAKGVDLIIADIVLAREGADQVARMREVAESMGANPNWSKVWWQEEQNRILREILTDYQNGREL